MVESTTQMPFKFRFVQDGQARGLRSKSASADATAVDLDGELIPYEDIADTSSQDKRLILALASTAHLGANATKALQEERFLVLEVQQAEAVDLERHIDRFSSAIVAERHRQELAAAGNEGLYRVQICPNCGATIDLSRFEQTSYVHCRFCQSLLDRGERFAPPGEGYQVCSECQMFGRVRGYTVFYFYFLLIVYGFSYGRRHLCDTCAVRQAQRALLLNFIFLLGIPTALYMWIKAATGRDPELKDLAQANALARKGKAREADAIYGRLQPRFPDHPGLLLNQGVGHLRAGELEVGAEYLNRALRACSNYRPALELAHRLEQMAERASAEPS